MPRDGSPARARLREAALQLFREHGYDATTAARIAARAGVSERTFFRHFADKREVLFDGEDELRAVLLDAIAAAPDPSAPLELLTLAFRAAVPLFVENRVLAARRAEVIAQAPALQERAHAKAVALTRALADALGARGVPAERARFAAEVGMAAFAHAHRRWTQEDRADADLETLIGDAAAEVLALGAAS